MKGFFSTQFVRQSDDGRNLVLTDNWWIIAAISLPLTTVTIAVWYCWIRFPWQRWWDQRRGCWWRRCRMGEQNEPEWRQVRVQAELRRNEFMV
jgi:hypothetical protein